MTKPRLNWSTIRESSLDFEAESEYHSIRNYCPCGRHFYDHFHAPRLASHLRHGKKWFVFPSPFIFLSHVVHVIVEVDGKIISWIMIFKFNRESSIIILLRNSCFKKEYLSSYILILFSCFNLSEFVYYSRVSLNLVREVILIIGLASRYKYLIIILILRCLSSFIYSIYLFIFYSNI